MIRQGSLQCSPQDSRPDSHRFNPRVNLRAGQVKSAARVNTLGQIIRADIVRQGNLKSRSLLHSAKLHANYVRLVSTQMWKDADCVPILPLGITLIQTDLLSRKCAFRAFILILKAHWDACRAHRAQLPPFTARAQRSNASVLRVISFKGISLLSLKSCWGFSICSEVDFTESPLFA